MFLFGGGSDWNNSFYPFDLDDVAQTEVLIYYIIKSENGSIEKRKLLDLL